MTPTLLFLVACEFHDIIGEPCRQESKPQTTEWAKKLVVSL